MAIWPARMPSTTSWGRAAHHACEVHCRACGAVFARAGPPPYRTICPYCVGDGEIVTLTEPAGRDCAQ